MELPIPIEGSCRAEYADGYIHDETAFSDTSPYINVWQEIQDEDGKWTWVQAGTNIFNDILEGRPTEHHGKMVRFSVFYHDNRYDFDWTKLPDNARPIRFKKMEADEKNGVVTALRLMGIGIGYQYNDEKGENIQDVMELR